MVGILVASAAFAQSDRGTITGTVADPTNAIVPGANVQVTNTETGAQYQTLTTSTGNYTLASLPVGTYNVTVEVNGFKKLTQVGIQVAVAQTARVDLVLQVGAASDAVTITADAPLLKTESADQSFYIVNDRIDKLPLPPLYVRNPLNWAGLVPGVVGNANGAAGSSTIKVNGSPATTYKVMVDGQDITSSIDPSHTLEQQPGVEALTEFTLQSSNFSAEFGQVQGGLFNFTSKSGTNEIHGSAYSISAMRGSTLTRLSLTCVASLGLKIGDSRWAGQCISRRFTTVATRPSSSSIGNAIRPRVKPPVSSLCQQRRCGTAISVRS